MDYDEMRAAVFAALEDHREKQEEAAPTVGAGMLPIEPFEAETSDGELCRAIGVVTNPGADCIEFVVLKTLDGGEMFPTTESSLWKREAAALTPNSVR